MSQRRWLWSLAFRNLRRNLRRNIMMGLAIAAAYGGILLFAGYVVWVEKYLRTNTVYLNQSGHITIARKDGLERQLAKPQGALLSLEEQKKILEVLRANPRVAHIGLGLRSFVLAVQGCQNRGVMAIGRDQAIDQMILKNSETQRWISELLHPEIQTAVLDLKARAPTRLALIPTPSLMKHLKGEGQSPCDGPAAEAGTLQIIARTYEGYTAVLDGQIAGEQSTGLALLDERSLFLSTQDLQKLLETDKVGSISVYAHQLLDVPFLYWELHQAFASSQPALDVLPFIAESVGLYYVGSIGFLGAVAGFFVLLVTAIVALTLLSLYTITLAERSLEIGVFLAMGFPNHTVARIFEIEALLLTIVSLLLGFITAYGASLAIIAQNIRFGPPGIAGMTRFTIAWEPWVTLCIGVLFLMASALSVRIIARIKLKQSALSLLQSSTTL